MHYFPGLPAATSHVSPRPASTVMYRNGANDEDERSVSNRLVAIDPRMAPQTHRCIPGTDEAGSIPKIATSNLITRPCAGFFFFRSQPCQSSTSLSRHQEPGALHSRQQQRSWKACAEVDTRSSAMPGAGCSSPGRAGQHEAHCPYRPLHSGHFYCLRPDPARHGDLSGCALGRAGSPAHLRQGNGHQWPRHPCGFPAGGRCSRDGRPPVPEPLDRAG